MGSGRLGLLGNRGYKDGVGQLFADAQAGIANLTDEIEIVAHKLDLLLFAQAHFPQAITHRRFGQQLFDANNGAGLDLA